jgi:hypothetical protein
MEAICSSEISVFSKELAVTTSQQIVPLIVLVARTTSLVHLLDFVGQSTQSLFHYFASKDGAQALGLFVDSCICIGPSWPHPLYDRKLIQTKRASHSSVSS